MNIESIIAELAQELGLTPAQQERAREILQRINREGSQASREVKRRLRDELRRRQDTAHE